MKNLFKKNCLYLLFSIAAFDSAIAQITLLNFKNLASDNQTLQAEFLSKNGYEFESSTPSTDKKFTRYTYSKHLSNSTIRKIILLPGKKIAIWATDNQSSFNSQKTKLLSETYSISSEKDIKTNTIFKCIYEIDDIKFNNSAENSAGIASYYILKSGYLLITAPFNQEGTHLYLITIISPTFCGN